MQFCHVLTLNFAQFQYLYFLIPHIERYKSINVKTTSLSTFDTNIYCKPPLIFNDFILIFTWDNVVFNESFSWQRFLHTNLDVHETPIP